MDERLRFADEFPVPSLDAWREKVERDLRGRDYADLAWNAPDGAPIEPLATRATIENLPHLAAAPQSWLGSHGAWRIRELIVTSEPSAAAEQARNALENDVAEIELCFDDLSRDAREPGENDEAPGVSGIAIHSLEDFRAAIEGIDLARAHIGISAGETALPALAYLVEVASERGASLDALHGDIDFDPISRLTQRQAGFDPNDDDVVVSTCTSIDHVFGESADVIRWCAEHAPGIRPLTLDAQGYHLSGASPARELECAIAHVVDVARRLAERGIDFDAFARASTVRMQVSHELLTCIAKLRAFRLLWAKVAHAFGCNDPASMRPNLSCVTSGRSRSYRYDTRTNLLRTTLAGFAAITGGCDSLAIVPFEEDPSHQDDQARRLARQQQLLLRDESYLDAVADPAGGSFAIEALTHRLAEAAWNGLQRIEHGGGLCESIRDGSLFSIVVETAEARTREFASRQRVLVGINRYVDPELEGESTHRPQAETAIDRVTRGHFAWLDSRDEESTMSAVDAFARGGDLVSGARAAARASATSAEIAMARWPRGEHFRHRFPPIALLDGDEFEELREGREGEPSIAIIAQLTVNRETRARAAFARSILRAAGYDVREPDPYNRIDSLIDAISEIGPQLVTLCGDDDGYAAAVERLEGVRCAVLAIGPDQPKLQAHGVAFVEDGADVIAVLTALAHGGNHEA